MKIPRWNARRSLHSEITEVHQDFSLSDGHPTPETNIAKLEHRVHEPVCTVNVVSALVNQSLLSRGKFVEAGYVSVCDGDEVKNLKWADCDNNRVRGRGPEGVAVPHASTYGGYSS